MSQTACRCRSTQQQAEVTRRRCDFECSVHPAFYPVSRQKVEFAFVGPKPRSDTLDSSITRLPLLDMWEELIVLSVSIN